MNTVVPAWTSVLNDESLISKVDAVSILDVSPNNINRFMNARNIKRITQGRKCFFKFGDIKKIIEGETK